MEEPDPTRSPVETSGGPSDFEKIGLPIIVLVVLVFIFFLVHAAITWLPESEWWKKITQNYKNVDEDKATFLQRRKGSLRRKLRNYKEKSKALGNDGRGGLSTGEVSVSDFDQVRNHAEDKGAETLSKSPSRSSIEENKQPLNVAKFYNQAFENDIDDKKEGHQPKGILRDKKVNSNLERYRHSAEFYSQFSLVPLENAEVGDGVNTSVESINATIHSSRHSSVETLNEGPVAPRRKKYVSSDDLTQRPKSRYESRHDARYDDPKQRPIAASMHDLRPDISFSFSDLQHKEIENDPQVYIRYSNKAQAKSVDDVRRAYASSSDLNSHKSAGGVGDSNGYLSHHNQRRDYSHPANKRVAESTRSVEDIRKVNGSNQQHNHDYNHGHNSRDNLADGGYSQNGLQVHRSTTRSADDLRGQSAERQYYNHSPGSLPSSTSSSRQSLESGPLQGSRQSLASSQGQSQYSQPLYGQLQNSQLQNGRTSYAKPRASKRAKRKAPLPGGMPNIPEHHTHHPTVALYGHNTNSSNDQPAVLPTSHVNYEMGQMNYRGPEMFNQGSAMV